jgi:hypothetical protein
VHIGTKNSDTDLIKEQVAVTTHIRHADGSPVSLYLLRDWTDKDIYDYLEYSGIEPDETRYIKTEKGWGNNPDKSLNADFYPACFNCVDRHQGKYVDYPKLKAKITNVSHLAPYEDIVIPDLGFRAIDWSKCTTAKNVERVAPTSGHGLSSNETGQTQQASRRKCKEPIIR